MTMTYLTLSRAARLAGVTRAELQRRIRRGDLETFEGSVAVHDLLRLYPSVSLSNDEAVERVERIRAQAVPKTQETDAVLPGTQVLVSRLKSLSASLTERMSALESAESLLAAVAERLAGLAALAPERLSAGLEETRAWLAAARRDLAVAPSPDLKSQLFAKDTFLRIMAANVKLIPSGHDFFVEGNESILAAAVRAGLGLGYGCASGNCGACKARLVSGELWKIRDHDYVLSERERSLGYVLTCCQTAVTDAVLEAAEAHGVADLPRQTLRATLRKLERVEPGLALLQVQTPRTQTLRFMAGQRARLTLEDGSTRELPIASCPCNGRNLWFYVRASDNAFARAVFGGLRAGQTIGVTGPFGDCVLRKDASEPAVFVAFGDGIAPIKSLIEQAVAVDSIESFHLYWASDFPQGCHLAHWARALKESLDNFRFTPLTTCDPHALIALIRADLPETGALRFYLAGPAAPVEALAAALRGLGVEAERLSLERIEG